MTRRDGTQITISDLGKVLSVIALLVIAGFFLGGMRSDMNAMQARMNQMQYDLSQQKSDMPAQYRNQNHIIE